MRSKPLNTFRRPTPSGFGKPFRLTGAPIPLGPVAFGDNMWTLTPSSTDGEVVITVSALPDLGDGAASGDGLGALTNIEYRYEGFSAWRAVDDAPATATGAWPVSWRLIQGETLALQIRAIGTGGRRGAPSALKTVVVPGAPQLVAYIQLPDGSFLSQDGLPIVQLVPAPIQPPAIFPEPESLVLYTGDAPTIIDFAAITTGQGVAYTAAWNGGALPATVTLVGAVLTINPTATLGAGTLTVTASNGGGETAATFGLEILAGEIPVTGQPAPRVLTVGTAMAALDLRSFINPAAGATLTYSAIGGFPWQSISGVGVVTGTPTAPTTSLVTYRVIDQLERYANIEVEYQIAGIPRVVDLFPSDYTVLTPAPYDVRAAVNNVGTITRTDHNASAYGFDAASIVRATAATPLNFHSIDRDFTVPTLDPVEVAAIIQTDTPADRSGKLLLMVRDDVATVEEISVQGDYAAIAATPGDEAKVSALSNTVHATNLRRVSFRWTPTKTGAHSVRVGPFATLASANAITLLAFGVARPPGAGPVFNTIRVSTTGNDSTGDGSIAAPYRTLVKALALASPGTIIDMAAGTYTETNIVLNTNLVPGMLGASEANPILVMGTRASAALDAAWQTTITRGAAGTPGTTITANGATKGIEFIDLHIVGTNTPADLDESAVKFNAANTVVAGAYTIWHEDVAFRRCRFTGQGTDVMKIVRGRHITVEGCLIENYEAYENGLDLLTIDGGKVRNNTFRSTFRTKDPLTLKLGSRDVLVELNVFEHTAKGAGGSSEAAIFVGNGSQAPSVAVISETAFDVAEALRITVKDNIIRPTKLNATHVHHGIRLAGAVDCTLDGNWISNVCSPAVQQQGSKSAGTSHEITLAQFNALTTAQRAAVLLVSGRYWVQHRALGNHILDCQYQGSGFPITSVSNAYHPEGGTNPTTTSIVSPATRGYLATGNVGSVAAPGFSAGHLVPIAA